MYKPKSESEIFFRLLKRKVFFFTLLVGAIFFGVTLRLWQLQVVQHKQLADRAENNRVRERVIDGLRGKIFDSAGKTLVDNRPSFVLSLVPEDTPDPKAVLALIGKKILIDSDEVLGKIRNAKKFSQVIIKHDLKREEVAFIEENRFDLPGVSIDIKPARNYLDGALASHLIGYLGAITEKQFKTAPDGVYTRNDYVGQYGIEKVFEKSLRGGKGLKRVEVDAVGRELATLGIKPALNGNDLTLSINRLVQLEAENAFAKAELMGAAVAIDPVTGEIISFVSNPSFDPNAFAHGVSRKDWQALTKNEFHPLQSRPIQGRYPPGSTFKPLVAIAALEEGVVTKDERIYCSGSLRFGKRNYRCWRRGGHGYMNVHDAIAQSCDVYFYTVGSRLGIDKIAKYAKMFGLGSVTGVKLGSENSGLIPTSGWKLRARKERWYPGETLSCAIGQGFVLATPFQMATVTAAIANGGKIVVPKLRKRGSDKTLDNSSGSKIPISSDNLEIIREAMRGVVYDEKGTAGRLSRVERPYEYAGKTGTAQVIRMKANEKWEHEKIKFKYRDHAWFIAWAPYENPLIAVAVIAEHAGHGGESAAPIAQKIIDTYLENFEFKTPVAHVNDNRRAG